MSVHTKIVVRYSILGVVILSSVFVGIGTMRRLLPHRCPPPNMDLNFKLLSCAARSRQIGAYESDGFIPYQIPMFETISGYRQMNRATIFSINNVNVDDWMRHRDDSVLAVGVMTDDDKFWVYAITPKGIWRFDGSDARLGAIYSEINQMRGQLEKCSAKRMGIYECPEESPFGFVRLGWYSDLELEEMIRYKRSHDR